MIELASADQYRYDWKAWKYETLPMIPENWKYQIKESTKGQFRVLKELLHRADVTEIICATDAGREGELIFRLVYNQAECKLPFKRLWISSMEEKAILEGFQQMKDGHEYDNLYYSAVARSEADWLVGMNGTRALTCRYNAQLSCGRVQTPTLALIASREQEIKSFVPKKYYTLTTVSHGMTWNWQDGKSGSNRSFDRGRIQSIAEKAEKDEMVITDVQRTVKKSYSPGLYDLTELQRDANKRFGYSAKETLNIMQRLYENHKVLTYPRTDSRYIGKDVAETLKERLQACAVGPYRKVAGKLLLQPIRMDKRFVDDSKVSDHHAIIPTEQFVQLDHMSSEERKIYDLVVRRFLAVLYPSCEYEQIKLTGSCAGEKWTAGSRMMKEAGWQQAYESEWEEEDDDSLMTVTSMPKLEKGRKDTVMRPKVSEGQTKPPAYYNEGTLLTAMEKGNLGTVATRADIIDKLFNSFLMEKKDKDIRVTSKGRQLLGLVPEDLKKPELTADWEKKLLAISEGRLKKDVFISEIRGYTEEIVKEIADGEGQFRHENLTNHLCPNCGKRMLSVQGKNSKMLVCQDRSCGYRDSIARKTNARCPKCHKKMEMYGKGDAQTFVCTCGYKEKLSAFQNRRKKEGAGVSKRDVQQYMKRQQKEANEPINNAFAAAFAKLNLETKEGE